MNISETVEDVGGIVGLNSGTVQTSSANNTVQVDKGNNVGGLVGLNTSTGQVTKSYATNIVSGYDSVGGLVGSNDGNISIAYSAGGGAIGHDQVGGLIGTQTSTGSASNVYAASEAAGNSHIGGLIGKASGSVSFAYAGGSVTGTGENVGGFWGARTMRQAKILLRY